MPLQSASNAQEIAIGLGEFVLADPVLHRAYLAQHKRADEVHPVAAYPIDIIGAKSLLAACDEFYQRSLMIEAAISAARGFDPLTTDVAASVVRRTAGLLVICAECWADGESLNFDPGMRLREDPFISAALLPYRSDHVA